jgi:hypothetical protein
MKNEGNVVDVTTTNKPVDIGWPNGLYTLMNDGAGSLWYREYRPGVTFAGNAATLGGNPAVIDDKGLGGAELKVGESIVIKGIAWDVVCGTDTGASATLRVMPGAKSASVNATITGVTVNSDLDSLAGYAINVEDGVKDAGTMVVNQASDGVVAAGNAILTTIDTDTGDIVANTADNATETTLGSVLSDTSGILGDTSSIDGKTPALGTALIGASVPVNIATTDTQFGAVGAASDPDGNIHGQLRSIAESVNGTTLIEKQPTWPATLIVGTPGTPEPLAGDGTFATYVHIEAHRAAAANDGNIHIGAGDGTGNGVDNATNWGHILDDGDFWDMTAAPGTMFDLNDIYYDGDDTLDGLVMVYIPA